MCVCESDYICIIFCGGFSFLRLETYHTFLGAPTAWTIRGLQFAKRFCCAHFLSRVVFCLFCFPMSHLFHCVCDCAVCHGRVFIENREGKKEDRGTEVHHPTLFFPPPRGETRMFQRHDRVGPNDWLRCFTWVGRKKGRNCVSSLLPKKGNWCVVCEVLLEWYCFRETSSFWGGFVIVTPHSHSLRFWPSSVSLRVKWNEALLPFLL